MQQITFGVVADDITGANDIGIMFTKAGKRACVCSGIPEASFRWEADAAIVDTDSRFHPRDLAYREVFAATRYLMDLGVRQFYKKTCSVFRGNIGAEFDAMLDALGEDFGVVILGFPANGRTTVQGIHYVYGVPLAESQFKDDPMNPMHCSDLREILSGQTARRVSNLTAEDLDRGAPWLRRRLQEEKAKGGYLIFDVRHQQDLALIAEVVQAERVICGASASAEEIAKWYPSLHGGRPQAQGIPDRQKGILITAGSLTRQTIAQVEYLRARGVLTLELESARLFEEEQRRCQAQQLRERAVREVLAGRTVVIHTSNRPEQVAATKEEGRRRGMKEAEVSRLVSGELARLAVQVLQRSGQRRVLIAGGDTSAAFCQQAEVRAMMVYREIESGLPSCIACGEDPLLMVLKSGSFGTPEFFEKAAAALRE